MEMTFKCALQQIWEFMDSFLVGMSHKGIIYSIDANDIEEYNIKSVINWWQHMNSGQFVIKCLKVRDAISPVINSISYRGQAKNTTIITMTSWWVQWRLKSPVSRLFTQPFIQAQIKEYIKAPRHWPLCGNSLWSGEFPAQMASNAENISIWWRHHG